jgi:predicted dienelactone hydrolase
MFNKRVRWIFYSLFPLALLFLSFTTGINLPKYFKAVTLHPQQTGITTFNYNDLSRSRPLVTEVWYPAEANSPSQKPPGFWIRCDEARDAPISSEQKKYPLIMMSHGFGCDRYNMSWLAETLAANGYIVAAMDHYGNTWNNKIPELYIQPWERPRDISFVLDQLLEDPRFKDRIDSKRIGFAGYSLGGATGMWIAGGQIASIDKELIKNYSEQDFNLEVSPNMIDATDFTKAEGSYKDPRISAVLVMAPALGWLFTEDSLTQIGIPVLIIAPEQDKVVPTEKNAKRFANKIAKATLKILPGEATHYVFLNRANIMGKRFIDQKYCEDHISINREEIHNSVCKNSVLFFDSNLK